MKNSRILSRRSFIKQSAVGAAMTLAYPYVIDASARPTVRKPRRPVPLILQTDLFRPHNDPDDHFDLACAYALAQRGAVNLLGVLCDFPPPKHAGDPDIAAVAMLNHLTGLSAPLVVGMPQRPASRRDPVASASACDLAGVNWLHKTLEASPEPVAIVVAGSCRDVAVAVRRKPELFARKCRAIYLNAGTGTPSPEPDDFLEYNVDLDPGSYASIFDAPCPLYWLPCFERLMRSQPFPNGVMPHGTFYRFPMVEVLPQLSAPLQRFFLSMLDREPATRWLESLRAPVDSAKLEAWGKQMRNMWCTAAFLHIAGLSSGGNGLLEPEKSDAPAYRFAPVAVDCDDRGRTSWRPGRSKPARFKFEVADAARYTGSMTKALRELIAPLGRA
jgi:hypothetical protein